jgi:hypothetical protein
LIRKGRNEKNYQYAVKSTPRITRLVEAIRQGKLYDDAPSDYWIDKKREGEKREEKQKIKGSEINQSD